MYPAFLFDKYGKVTQAGSIVCELNCFQRSLEEKDQKTITVNHFSHVRLANRISKYIAQKSLIRHLIQIIQNIFQGILAGVCSPLAHLN